MQKARIRGRGFPAGLLFCVTRGTGETAAASRGQTRRRFACEYLVM